MDNEKLIETTKDIVIAMINNQILSQGKDIQVNQMVTDAIDEVYKKLAEINSKDFELGSPKYK